MIHEVDSALRTLIEREADGMRDVEIVFDAPTREWAGRRNAPTVDVYLYDIREDLRRRERGMHNVYDERKRIVSRHLPPRHFKLSYLVTAWTQRPEDEHRLLSSLLTCFLRYDALPTEVLTGPLTELGLPVPITIALPPPEDRAFADVWSALGGELKPSIDLVVITPLDTGQQFHTGPPVAVPPRVALGGSNGWPTRETKSRDGVEVWPEGAAGRTRLGIAGGRSSGPAGSTSAQASGGEGATDDAADQTTRRGGAKKTSRSTSGRKGSAAGTGSETAGADEATAAASGGPTDSGPSDWQAATSWADAMAPLGSPESVESAANPVAGRSAAPGKVAGAAPAGSSGPAESAGSSPTSTAKGRPGPRVAMTRVRQTKKRS